MALDLLQLACSHTGSPTMVGDAIEADNMEVGTGSTYFNNNCDVAMDLIKHGAFEESGL